MMPPMGFPVLAICFFVGIVTAASKFVYSRHQSYKNHKNQHNYRNECSPAKSRNLTCPFCGQPTVANDYPLVCGHLCHVTCFRSRPASTRDNCSFCHNNRDDEVVVLGTSTSRLHEETKQRLNRQPLSNNNENDLSAESPPKLLSVAASPKKVVDCAYCSVTLDFPKNHKQLNCGHYAHQRCFENLKDLIKCETCNCNNYSSDCEDKI